MAINLMVILNTFKEIHLHLLNNFLYIPGQSLALSALIYYPWRKDQVNTQLWHGSFLSYVKYVTWREPFGKMMSTYVGMSRGVQNILGGLKKGFTGVFVGLDRVLII